MKFELPNLPYGYDDLSPYISRQTLEFHHDKHHATYVNNLNNLIAGTEYEKMSLEDIIINSKEKGNMPVFNNAAQVFNHTFFFECMKKNGGGEVPEEISKHFGGKENFIKTFKEAGITQFGSGWAWLLKDKFGNLKIVKMPNAETPVMYGEKPLLTIDVWEHAYYLDYQNKRADFIDTFLNNLVNWDFVLKNLK